MIKNNLEWSVFKSATNFVFIFEANNAMRALKIYLLIMDIVINCGLYIITTNENL